MDSFDFSGAHTASRTAKVSSTNLPQEYELDRLVKDIKNAPISWSTNTPACSWHGVQCSVQDELQEICWEAMKLRGTLQLRYLSKCVKHFSVSGNQFYGEVSLDDLPPRLVTLRLDDNKFQGPVNLSALPSTLQRLSLNYNKFTGEVCLINLPQNLEKLYLSDNGFSGELDLTQLPMKIQYIWLDNNQFTGIVDLSLLPAPLKILYLEGNADLCGEISTADLSGRARNGIFVKDTKIKVFG